MEKEWKPTHRHFKGGLYKFLFVATNSENYEDMAVYQSENGNYWVRPLEMFNGTLQYDSEKRFEDIREKE